MNTWARVFFPWLVFLVSAAGIFQPSEARASDINEASGTLTAKSAEPPLPYEPWRGGSIPAPKPEADRGPPPRERPVVHLRRSVELVPELSLALPTCQSGPDAAPCSALGPALGGGLAVLYRATPYFGFGASLSYARATGRLEGTRELELERFGVHALGRVYLYEEGAFDPYLELELGYAEVRTRFAPAPGLREEQAAFGPSARVGGGLEFVVFESLRLGAMAGFAHFVLARGERCAASECVTGGAPGGAATGGLVLALRAAVLFGDRL